jgi:hypothetical protein
VAHHRREAQGCPLPLRHAQRLGEGEYERWKLQNGYRQKFFARAWKQSSGVWLEVVSEMGAKQMNRFLFGVALTSAFIAGMPSLSWGQDGRTRRVGVLLTSVPSDPSYKALWQALADGLREHGWEEGRNFVFEARYAGPDPARFPELAAELAALKVGVIISGQSQAIDAARRATTTIPIIMAGPADPVGSGFVVSLARPGGISPALRTKLKRCRPRTSSF